MAKVVVRLPEPKEDYDESNQKQINRAVALIVEQLNSTFLDELKQETERFTWFKSGSNMANIYKNANFDLTTTNVTDIYTVPSNSRAIIQNIHTANVGGGNTEIKAFLYDNSATTAFQFAEHTVNSGDSKSISDGSIVLEENDKLQLQAATADIFEGTCAILEINRE